MNMFPYAPTSLFPMLPHHHHHHHHQHHQSPNHQQALYAQQQQQQQQQQQASVLYYQYNQLRPMQATYSNPTLPSIKYDQVQKVQQPYRLDQLVPSTSPQSRSKTGANPVSPEHMLSLPMPDARLQRHPLQNPDAFRPILRTISNSMLEPSPYSSNTISISSISSSPPAPVVSTPSGLPYRHHRPSKQGPTLDEQQRRQRLHSGSSCYESDSPKNSSDDEEGPQGHPIKPSTAEAMLLPSKKRSRSLGRPDLMGNDLMLHDVYQTSGNGNNLFPVINLTAISINNPYSSAKTNLSVVRPKLLQYIEENIIGKDYVFQGPWGLRRMIYCDYTASGRSLHFIENYIKTYVLPLYGNTHSETSLCAQQSTKFREEARSLIKKSVNANENDVLLFTGTGSTGAVHTLADNFDLHNQEIREKTVVIISAFEHHSNILPWQETGVEMVRIPTTKQGILDQANLKAKLEHYVKLNKRIICSLNAASNISGILTDVDAVSTLVHTYGGLIFWDYATAAPYVPIDMNPSPTAYKDAMFISTHKFIGGPGTSGILIAKKYLFSLKPPRACGGGTVNFVTRTSREYNHDIEIREEGGTPDIIGCIRAGLVFQLKDSIDMDYMQARENELVKRFYRRFKKLDTLILLGPSTPARLPIFSFVVYVPGVCKYLHHNFICLLLNDLFGIQVRSGCACAGPYALDLLNVDDAKTDIYCMFMTEDACARVDSGDEPIVRTMMMKPGFTRLNLPFFVNDDEIEYVLNAVQFIATDGWKFLPLYTYDPATAGWSHRNGFQLAQSSLEDISYRSGKMQYHTNRKDSLLSRGAKILPDPFREAKIMASDALRRALTSIDYTSDPPLNVPDKYKHMVWFALPIDIALMMVKQRETGEETLCHIDSIPFIPDDAKERLTSSARKKELTNGADLSVLRKKPNSNRLSSTSRTR